MKSTPAPNRSFYSTSFKLGVVRRVAMGELTKEQARLEYGIPSNSAIVEWMRKFGYCSDPHKQPLMAKTIDNMDAKELKKKVLQLEKQLQNERIRSQLYQTMIDVAERELGIAIRKTSDTNPSD